jgi:hypothetical protein
MRSRSPNGVLTASKAIDPTTVSDMEQRSVYRDGYASSAQQRGGAGEAYQSLYLSADYGSAP